MSNDLILVSVQPCKPGSGDPKFSGLSGVFYYHVEHDLRVFFAVTLRAGYTDTGEPVYGTIGMAEHLMKEFCEAHAQGRLEIDPACFWRDPADQRPAEEATSRNAYDRPENSPQPNTSSDGRHMFINKGYKVKRMVDEDKVYYEIAFRMANGKEADHPAKIYNENYLKMLAKALVDAGYEPHKWESGKAHPINIEFGITKSDKVGKNGKAFNNYEYFKVIS